MGRAQGVPPQRLAVLDRPTCKSRPSCCTRSKAKNASRSGAAYDRSRPGAGRRGSPSRAAPVPAGSPGAPFRAFWAAGSECCGFLQQVAATSTRVLSRLTRQQHDARQPEPADDVAVGAWPKLRSQEESRESDRGRIQARRPSPPISTRSRRPQRGAERIGVWGLAPPSDAEPPHVDFARFFGTAANRRRTAASNRRLNDFKDLAEPPQTAAWVMVASNPHRPPLALRRQRRRVRWAPPWRPRGCRARSGNAYCPCGRIPR